MNNLKNLRLKNRYSQTDVAKASGVSRQAYVKYETGEVEPPLFVLRNLARFYNISIQQLAESQDEVAFNLDNNSPQMLTIREPASDVNYGDSVFEFVSKTVETMSFSNLRLLSDKITSLLSASFNENMDRDLELFDHFSGLGKDIDVNESKLSYFNSKYDLQDMQK